MRDFGPDLVEQPTADDYVAAARHFVEQGELGAGLQQLAAALSYDPMRPDLLELLEEILAASGDPLQQTAVGAEAFFGLVAVRAWALARAGRSSEALALLLDVVEFRPTVPYLEWTPGWVSSRKQAKALSLARHAGRVLEVADGLELDQPGQRRNLEAAIELAEAVRERSAGANPLLALLITGLLRRAGRLDRAMAIAERELTRAPSWRAAVELGAIHRARGELEQAARRFRKATTLDPRERSAHVDLGDVLLQDGRFEPAQAAYQLVLDREPEHRWARPSSLAARHLATGHEDAREQLEILAGSGPAAQRASSLVRLLGLYRRALPDPGDLCAQVVVDGLTRAAQSPTSAPARIRIRSPFPEAPSLHLALRIGMASLGREGSLTVEAEQAREASVPSGPPSLWDLSAQVPRTVPEPPAAMVSQAVATLAETTFDVDAWAHHAVELRSCLSQAELAQLPASMVHPPNPTSLPLAALALRWVFRCQVAAAMLLVCGAGRRDESTSSSALTAIARGPDDWTVAAAAIALGWLAQQDRSARPAVLAVLDEQRQRAVEPQSPTVQAALAWRLALSEPGDPLRAEIWRALQAPARQL